MDWILLTYRLPSGTSRARVTVWREVRRSGALHLQQSVVAFPADAAFERALERLRVMVGELGGQTLVLRGRPSAPGDRERLETAWQEARAAEYRELAAECEKLVNEIEKEFSIQKFTLAELEEEEAELEKLQAWHERIAERDVLGTPGAEDAREALARAGASVERFGDAVFQRTEP